MQRRLVHRRVRQQVAAGKDLLPLRVRRQRGLPGGNQPEQAGGLRLRGHRRRDAGQVRHWRTLDAHQQHTTGRTLAQLLQHQARSRRLTLGQERRDVRPDRRHPERRRKHQPGQRQGRQHQPPPPHDARATW